MEQQLVNAFMKLMAKAGAGSFIKDMVQEVDENRNPKVWSPSEIEKAIRYVTWQTENFGAPEATAIIEILLKKYNLHPADFIAENRTSDTSGVQGLQ